MKWLNYHHLMYFRVIANEGTISKASEILKVGQPALSSQLKTFEEYLGYELFDRTHRIMSLTDAGKLVLEYANQINSLGQEMIKTVEDGKSAKKIHLSIGSLDCIPKHFISHIVDFAYKKTGCQLSIFEGDNFELLRQLDTFHIEAFISDQDHSSFSGSEIFSKEIYSSDIHVYGNKKTKQKKMKLKDLIKSNQCILPTYHSKLRKDLDNYFSLNQVFPDIIAQTQDTALQKILASKGDGLVFLPKFAAYDFLKLGTLHDFGKLSGVKANYYLIYKERMIQNPALKVLLEEDLKNKRPS